MHRLAMRARPDELPRMALWLEAALVELGLDERRAYALQLVAEELVGNVILHARPVADEVRIELLVEAAPLRFVIEDDAVGFDPTAAGPVAAVPDLGSAAIGGRGLLLVRRFSQGWRYNRTEGRNRVEVLL